MAERDAGSKGTDSRGIKDSERINQLAADVREIEDYAEAFLTGETKRRYLALVALVGTLQRDNQRWLAWSKGVYPDDSPGDVISAETDGTIVLDDGITTWNPLRALEWFAAQVGTLQQERDTLENRWLDDNARAVAAERRAEHAEAALESNTAEWVRINVEEWERIAAEKGIPFLLDHLGLDGLGNEVKGMKAALAEAKEQGRLQRADLEQQLRDERRSLADSLKENQDLRKQVEASRQALADIAENIPAYHDEDWHRYIVEAMNRRDIARRALAEGSVGTDSSTESAGGDTWQLAKDGVTPDGMTGADLADDGGDTKESA